MKPLHPLMLAFASPMSHQGVAVDFSKSQVPLRSSEDSPVGQIPLRIMPLGASITYGWRSTDQNGYRGYLRDKLTAEGTPVNMVGSRQAGSMKDNDVEGWPGFRIDQVLDKARAAVPTWKPNLILINAGTNDCLQNRNVSTAGERMAALVDELYAMSPRTTVVLSSLIVNRGASAETNVLDVNEQFATLAQRLRDDGRPLIFADMHGPDSPDYRDLADDTHPQDAGYMKMADTWYDAIVDAVNNEMIQPAEVVPGVPDDGS